jgi:hypothetical protein
VKNFRRHISIKMSTTTANNQQFIKTRLCRYFQMSRCYKGDHCSHAHSQQELQERPDLRKTALCRAWNSTGSCSNGDDCAYAHGQGELRAPCSLTVTDVPTCSPTLPELSVESITGHESAILYSNTPELEIKYTKRVRCMSAVEPLMKLSSRYDADFSPSAVAISDDETWRSDSRSLCGTPIATPILAPRPVPVYTQESNTGGHWVYYPPPIIMQQFSSSPYYYRTCTKDSMAPTLEDTECESPRSLVNYNLDS